MNQYIRSEKDPKESPQKVPKWVLNVLYMNQCIRSVKDRKEDRQKDRN